MSKVTIRLEFGGAVVWPVVEFNHYAAEPANGLPDILEILSAKLEIADGYRTMIDIAEYVDEDVIIKALRSARGEV